MTKFSLWRTGAFALIVVIAFAVTFQGLRGSSAQAPSGEDNMVRAPEFPANADWLNTDKPLMLRALKGKIVLLDFWTYCCINCMHILPDLKKLERKYPNELVIIGVHSAKFENEGDTANIRNAIMRYKIEHPVLNDNTLRVWNEYTVRAWPTLVLIDPNGRIVGQLAGEGHYEEIDNAIEKLVKEFSARGELRDEPSNWSLEAAKVQNTPLSYPGKVLADTEGKRLFVADSNHNRIVISDLQGNVQSVAGSGVQGFGNGAFASATFHNPQGMALSEDGGTLYVADTDNHAIRALNLKEKTVATVAGTGKQGGWRTLAGPGATTSLASPWDLARVDDTLYIAMAGSHQVWSMDLPSRNVQPYAGSGREARLDANLSTAALAQPSGLAVRGKDLLFADSESSSIRSIALPGGDGQVNTLVGGDPNPANLFAFGDRAGKGFDARLQHPLGVAGNGGDELYVADTYNHKIKVLNLANDAISDLAGSGRGSADGSFKSAGFNEPGGLSLGGDKLYVADTNNHQIRVLDLKAQTVSTVQWKGLPTAKPAEPERTGKVTKTAAIDEGLALPLQTVAAGKGELVFNVNLPAGFHLNREAPLKWQARAEGAGLVLGKTLVKGDEFKLPLRIPYTATAGAKGVVVATAGVYYCTDNMGICKVQTVRLRLPFQVEAGGAGTLKMEATITADDRVKSG